jgi:hypothetical protein
MGFLRLLIIILISLIYGCSHPLEIEGEGDIVSESGTRDCVLEDHPCANIVAGSYLETYTAVAKPGWKFTGWKNCGDQSAPSRCAYNISKVPKQFYGKTVQPLVAMFSELPVPSVTKFVPEDPSGFGLPFEISEVIYDRFRSKAYVMDKAQQRLYIVDLSTGLIANFFVVDSPVAAMTFSDEGDKLYLAMGKRGKDDVSDDIGQYGYILALELDNPSLWEVYRVDVDPYDIAVLPDKASILVSSDESLLLRYTIGDELDLNIEGELAVRPSATITSRGYGGYITWAEEYRKFEFLYDVPEVSNLVTYDGGSTDVDQAWFWQGVILTDSGSLNKYGNDQGVIEGLEGKIVSLNIDLQRKVFIVIEESDLGEKRLKLYDLLNDQSLVGVIEGVDSTNIVSVYLAVEGMYTFTSADGNSELSLHQHPCEECGFNFSPEVNGQVLAVSDAGLTVELDALAIIDFEDGRHLSYRWDFDNDDAWDTDFSSSPKISYQYTASGFKTAVVEAKDSQGASILEAVSFNVGGL